VAGRKDKRKTTRRRPNRPVTAGQARNNIDPAIVHRRQSAVNQLRADGYQLREIPDALLTAHVNEGSPPFTFVGPDRQPLAESTLSYEELRERAYDLVRQDVKRHRDEVDAEQPSAMRLQDDRYVLAERPLVHYKRLILRMEGDASRSVHGERDNSKYNMMLRTAIELAVRIARLQGIATERPAELRLPERYRAWFADDGIIHREK